MILQIDVPDAILNIPTYTTQDLLLDVAVALYQRRMYSLAKSARFAGVDRLQFQKILSERHVPLFYDLEIDIATLQNL